MEYLLRGVNELGDPVEVRVRTCWRCWCLVNVSVASMEDHVDQCHPVGGGHVQPRHALRGDRRPPD